MMLWVNAFYSDTFVLPLPDGHRFPMAKYARLRERLLAEQIVTGAKNLPVKKESSHLDLEFEGSTTGDEPYLAALAHTLTEVMRHSPEFVFYLAGADPYEGDRLGRLELTIDGLRRRDELVLSHCRHHRIPVAITKSGRHAPDVDAIVAIHTNTIRTAVSLWDNAFAY
jgi:acetoin utilization deacetylase AcuC-like enzyme